MRLTPSAFAHWQAIRPTPPAAACHRIVSPGLGHEVQAAQQVLHGEALQHHARGLLEGDAVGQLHQAVGRHGALGVRAERAVAVGDAVAHLELGHARADGLDHARALDAEARRQRHRIEAGAMVGVDVVEADRVVARRGPRPGRARRRRRLPTAGLRDRRSGGSGWRGPCDVPPGWTGHCTRRGRGRRGGLSPGRGRPRGRRRR